MVAAPGSNLAKYRNLGKETEYETHTEIGLPQGIAQTYEAYFRSLTK